MAYIWFSLKIKNFTDQELMKHHGFPLWKFICSNCGCSKTKWLADLCFRNNGGFVRMNTIPARETTISFTIIKIKGNILGIKDNIVDWASWRFTWKRNIFFSEKHFFHVFFPIFKYLLKYFFELFFLSEKMNLFKISTNFI